MGDCIIAELTEEEKQDDFKSFYDTIAGSVSFRDEINDLYLIDFREHYEYYEKKIRETEDNFEFYCTLEAICRDVSSFHTDMDLRGNYVGKIFYAQEYLYPALYKDDITQTYHCMVPNKVTAKNEIVRLLLGAQNDEDFYLLLSGKYILWRGKAE